MWVRFTKLFLLAIERNVRIEQKSHVWQPSAPHGDGENVGAINLQNCFTGD